LQQVVGDDWRSGVLHYLNQGCNMKRGIFGATRMGSADLDMLIHSSDIYVGNSKETVAGNKP